MRAKDIVDFASSQGVFRLVDVYFLDNASPLAYELTQKIHVCASHSTFDVVDDASCDYSTVCIMAASSDRGGLFSDSAWSVFVLDGDLYPRGLMARCALGADRSILRDAPVRLAGRIIVSKYSRTWDTAFPMTLSSYSRLSFAETSKHNAWLRTVSAMKRADALAEVAKEQHSPWFFSGFSTLADPWRTLSNVRRLFEGFLMPHLRTGHRYKRWICENKQSSFDHIEYDDFSPETGIFWFSRPLSRVSKLGITLTEALQVTPCAWELDGDLSDTDDGFQLRAKLTRHKRKYDFLETDSDEDGDEDKDEDKPPPPSPVSAVGDIYMTLDGWAMMLTENVFVWFVTPKDMSPKNAKTCVYDYYISNYEHINLDIADARVQKLTDERANEILAGVCPCHFYCDNTSLIAPFPKCIERDHGMPPSLSSMNAILSSLRGSFDLQVDFGGKSPDSRGKGARLHRAMWEYAASCDPDARLDFEHTVFRSGACDACGLKRGLSTRISIPTSLPSGSLKFEFGSTCSERARILWRLFFYYHKHPWHVFAYMFLYTVDELYDLQKTTSKKYPRRFIFD